jgi:hypothetical protein
VKTALSLVCLLTICNLTLNGQTVKTPRSAHVPETSAIHVAGEQPDVTLKKIFTNLGSSSTDLFDDEYGWYVAGPDVKKGYSQQFVGLPFTPKSNSHVSQVQLAVEYFSSGTNQVNVSIYGDSGGHPGSLLAGPVTVKNLPKTGTCCALTVANFTPVAVTGGSQYWVVAETPASGTGSNFLGLWDFIVQGKTPTTAFEFTDSGPWGAEPSLGEPAGEVLGTIP